MNLSVIMCFRPGCSSVDCKEECLSLYIVDLRLMPYKCPPSALTTCRYESGTWVTETRTDTWGVTPCAYSGTYNTFFIYNSKQQCLVKTRCFRGGTWWVSKAWLAVLDRRGHLNRASQGDRSRERERVSFNLVPFAVFFFFFQLSPHTFISLLSLSPLPLLFSFILSVCTSGPAHVMYLRMLDRSSKVHSWGTSGFSIMRCHSRCSSPYESIQSTSFP